MHDDLFKKPTPSLSDFEFNAQVADVFDDMLNRSIPFYNEIQRMIVDFVGEFAREESTIYDLGCSTGALMQAIMEAHPPVRRIVGIDNSKPMLDKARLRLVKEMSEGRATLRHADLKGCQIDQASVVVMNYTLQFVRPLYRAAVLDRIYQGLLPGGVLILSEKVLEDSGMASRLFGEMYYRFKKRMGYTQLEISRKREQLENVLVPYRLDEQIELLNAAGFEKSAVFFKWHNFASIIAIKAG